jgi:hypothetical protein
MRKRWIGFTLVLCLAGILLAVAPILFRRQQVGAQVLNVYASPIQAGCYIAGPNDCRIHVEPFTIDLTPGSRLELFQLVAFPQGFPSSTIYDFKPDSSNPVPFTGSNYTPTLVTQDFAATCGRSYQISLQGKDTLDTNTYNLGVTGIFTCPSGVP